jgi:serine/threonine-protein phosphatase 6 regulatory ankyrin repeat subunit B
LKKYNSLAKKRVLINSISIQNKGFNKTRSIGGTGMKCRLNLCLVIAVVFVLGVGHAAAMTPLIEAAKKGDTQKVQALLAKGEDVNAEDDETGHTALQWAAHEGHTDTVQAMLAEERVSTLKAQLASALGCAASNGHTATVQVLLAKGADVEGDNDDGWTPLLYAAQHGYTDTVQALLALGVDVNTRSGSGRTALMAAAKQSSTEIVQALLAKGADVNAEDKEGTTALIEAAAWGHVENVQALLKNGADVNASDISGYTALMWPSKKGNIEIVQALLSHGTDVNAKNRDGDTALTLAKSNRNEWEDTKKLYALMAQSADKNGKDLNDYIASTYETGERFEDIVILLKKSGAREKRH